MFKNWFTPQKKETSIEIWIKEHGIPNRLDALKPEIQCVAARLSVYLPDFRTVPYMFDYEGTFRLANCRCAELLKGDPCVGKYMNESLILIGCFDPATGRALSDAEVLFICIHELRHRWQDKYRPDIYGTTNTWGAATLFDPSEIDADAFAIAYMHKYTTYDPQEYMDLWRFVMLLDGGKRYLLSRIYEKAMDDEE